MYYDDQSKQTQFEQQHVAGMGFLPLIIGAAASIIPAIAPLFMKKPKRDRGPSQAQIAAEMARVQAEAAAAEKKKWQKYGLIGLGAVVVIGGGLALLARRKRQES